MPNGIIKVCVWNGNIQEVLEKLICYSREITIRVYKGRLIVKDPSTEHYQSVIKGDDIELPASKYYHDPSITCNCRLPEEEYEEESS